MRFLINWFISHGPYTKQALSAVILIVSSSCLLACLAAAVGISISMRKMKDISTDTSQWYENYVVKATRPVRESKLKSIP
jgi:hypothetical protein